jgi:exodeoxyribonuclease V alpha subunit
MLFRNLVYTALTRAKKMAVFVGARSALDLAVRNVDARARQIALAHLLRT